MLKAAKSGHTIVFAVIWLVICVLIVSWRLSGGTSIQTDIRAILPEDRHAPAVEEALSTANANASNRLALLINAGSPDVAKEAADDLQSQLLASGLFVNDLEDSDVVGRWFFENRRELSCERTADGFDDAAAQAVRKQALARIYGVTSPVTSDLLKADPFLLTLRLSECLSSGVARGLGQNQQLVSGRLTRSAFQMQTQGEVLALIGDWRANWEDRGVTLYRSGAVFHASQAASQAQGEISLIGGAGIVGVIILFWFVFGRAKNIAVTALLIGASCLSGFAVTLLVFDQVHMLALVFAAMLVGVVADYAVHAMAASTACGWAALEERFAHLVRPMTISMLTTATGFGGLAFLGVDLFRQLAVFAVSGVATAWVLVLLVYLQLDTRPKYPAPILKRWTFINDRLDAIQPPALAGLGFGLLMLTMALAGATQGGVLDDIRQFQARDADLMAEEEKVAAVFGGGMDQVFLISQGTTPEDARQREEAAIAAAPEDVRFLALSRFDPSQNRRAENQAALETNLEVPYLDAHLATLGLSAEPPSRETEGLERPNFLTDLEFDGRDGMHYLVARVSNADQWAGPDMAGVTLVDAADQYSRAFGRYRELGFRSLFIAAAVAGLFVVIVYGRLSALAIVAAPFAAVITGIWLPVLFGAKASFFSMAGGMVLFGVGVDYSAFAWESAQRRENWTRTSVLVGAVTTLLSMGLMMLSDSYPVRSFGLTVSTGVIAALCFSVAPFLIAKGGLKHANAKL